MDDGAARAASSDALRERYEAEGLATERYESTSYWDRRYHRRRFDHVSRHVGELLLPGDRFLDVGCGTGEYLRLAAAIDGVDAVGVDLSESYARRAAGRWGQAATHAVVGSATRLPLPDRSCDVVLCSEVIEHVPPELGAACVRELTRVCRRAVVLTTPNVDAAIRRVARRAAPGRVDALDREVGHVNLLSVRDLRALVAATSWVEERMEVHHVVPPLLGELPVSVSPRLGVVADRAERVGDRWFPSGGNSVILTLRPR
jgi:SAM-dependent methyltransferase